MNPTTTRIAPVDAKTLPPYAPTTYVDFTKPEHRAAFEKALAQVRSELGREYPIVIGGQSLKADKTFESLNPARPSEIVGRFPSASREQATQAIEVAHRAFAHPGAHEGFLHELVVQVGLRLRDAMRALPHDPDTPKEQPRIARAEVQRRAQVWDPLRVLHADPVVRTLSRWPWELHTETVPGAAPCVARRRPSGAT